VKKLCKHLSKNSSHKQESD